MKKIYLDTEYLILHHMVNEQAKRQNLWVMISDKNNADITVNPSLLGLKFPFRIGELVDKISYEISGRGRFAPTDSDHVMGDFTLSGDGNFLHHTPTSKKINLTDKEYLILKSLADKGDVGLDRQALLNLVWGYADSAETHTIETHMYRLRQKLEQEFGDNFEITNTNGLYHIELK
jgi:DNA-binding response OmpR family regulator